MLHMNGALDTPWYEAFLHIELLRHIGVITDVQDGKLVFDESGFQPQAPDDSPEHFKNKLHALGDVVPRVVQWMKRAQSPCQCDHYLRIGWPELARLIDDDYAKTLAGNPHFEEHRLSRLVSELEYACPCPTGELITLMYRSERLWLSSIDPLKLSRWMGLEYQHLEVLAVFAFTDEDTLHAGLSRSSSIPGRLRHFI